MEKLFECIGVILLIPLIAIEGVVKFLCAIIYFTLKPIWKPLFGNCVNCHLRRFATKKYFPACDYLYRKWAD